MYESFAPFYDCLTANVDYEKRADYFCQVMARHGRAAGKLLLDLGCGTGSLSLALARRGWDVIGADCSEAMLAQAMQKLDDFHGDKKPLFLKQNMQTLDLFGTVDVCICALDSLNHITEYAQLERVFKRLALFVETGGVFIFDVNTLYKHRTVLSNQTFVLDKDDVFCAWQNTLKPENVVEIELDFFHREPSGLYSRMQECFCERAYSQEALCAAGSKAGFETIAIYSADSFSAPKDDDERLVFVMENMMEHRSYPQ